MRFKNAKKTRIHRFSSAGFSFFALDISLKKNEKNHALQGAACKRSLHGEVFAMPFVEISRPKTAWVGTHERREESSNVVVLLDQCFPTASSIRSLFSNLTGRGLADISR